MRTTVIDSSGRHWGPGDPGFLRSIQVPRTAPGMLDYVTKNMGFAVVTASNRSLRIRFRPAVIGQLAMAETLTWCLSQQADRAMVTYFSEPTEEWAHVLIASVAATAQRLVDLVNDAQLRPAHPFQRTLVDLDRLPADHPVVPLVARWRQTGGEFDPIDLQPLLDRTFAGRHMVVRVLDDGARLIVQRIAPGYSNVKPCIGNRIEDQIDYAYGRWVAESYREAHRQDAPRLEKIDATLRRPNGRFRYERLILPYETPSRDRLLLSGTLLN